MSCIDRIGRAYIERGSDLGVHAVRSLDRHPAMITVFAASRSVEATSFLSRPERLAGAYGIDDVVDRLARRRRGRFVFGEHGVRRTGEGTVRSVRREAREIVLRGSVDLPDTAADQLRWLADAGLSASIVLAEADLAILRGDRS